MFLADAGFFALLLCTINFFAAVNVDPKLLGVYRFLLRWITMGRCVPLRWPQAAGISSNPTVAFASRWSLVFCTATLPEGMDQSRRLTGRQPTVANRQLRPVRSVALRAFLPTQRWLLVTVVVGDGFS